MCSARRMRVLSAATLLAALFTPRPAVAQDREACVDAYEQGQVAMRRGKLTAARAELQRCLSDACPGMLRSDCAIWLKEVDGRVPSVLLSATTMSAGARRSLTNVRVLVDGFVVKKQLDGSAVDVDPGGHTFRFEPEGGTPVELNVVVREGEKLQPVAVEVTLPTAPSPVAEPVPLPVRTIDHAPRSGAADSAPVPVPSTVYALAAVGAAAAGGFVAFAVMGNSGHRDLEPCKPACASSDVNIVRTKYIVADVMLGLSLVALGAAAYIYFTRQNDAPVRAHARRPRGLRPDFTFAF